MSLNRVSGFLALAILATAGQGRAQAAAAAAAGPPLPPATKLEAFRPAAGTVVTFGYNNLGTVSAVSVDVREIRDTRGGSVRGLQVEVKQGEYRDETAFVDADEIPELLKGFDVLLAVKSNPTSFKSFEVQYTTRGELRLTAFNMKNGTISYAVQAGRTLKAQQFLDEAEMRKLRGFIEAAGQTLSSSK